MSQTNQTVWARNRRRPEARYESLLEERIRIGLLFVDATCHTPAFDDAERLFHQCQLLDRQLRRFRRYSNEEFRIVLPAEDRRWHVPAIPPATPPACRLCLKTGLMLPMDIVLPAQAQDQKGRAA